MQDRDLVSLFPSSCQLALLTKLDLSQNSLQSLASLQPGLGLQQLHLQHNYLQQLPEGGFSGSGGLLLLNISHNQLGPTLPTNTFQVSQPTNQKTRQPH